MKKNILFFTGTAAMFTIAAVVSFDNEAVARPTGISGVSGVTATCENCHNGIKNKVDNGSTATLSSDIPAEGYTPGKVYNMALTIYSKKSQVGFNIRAQNGSGALAGSLGQVSSNAQITTFGTVGGSAGELTHTGANSITGGKKEITFQWTAPATGTGDVNYFGVVATGIDRNNSMDSLNKLKVVFKENIVTSVEDETSTGIALQVYPSHVKDNFIISYSLSVPSEVLLQVFDMKGSAVKKVFEGSESNGTHQKQISSDGLEEGVYLVYIQVNGHNTAKRIVVRK